MIRQPDEPADSTPKYSEGILSHQHIPEPDYNAEEGWQRSKNMRHVIFATRINNEGERVMQIIAEVFEQPGFPEQGAANAERFVDCWNRFDEGAGHDEAEDAFTEKPDISPSFANAVNSLIAYALTCRSDHADWLREMARHINKVATQLGDPDRAEYDGEDGLQVVQKAVDIGSD
jgi:hypothetical protein